MSRQEWHRALKHGDPRLAAHSRHLLHFLVLCAQRVDWHLARISSLKKLFFVMLLLFFTKRSLPMSLSLRLPCQWIAGESCSTLWICRSSSRIWQKLFPSLPSVFRFSNLDSLYGFEKWSPQVELRWLCCSEQGTGVRGEVNVGQSKGTAGEQTF